MEEYDKFEGWRRAVALLEEENEMLKAELLQLRTGPNNRREAIRGKRFPVIRGGLTKTATTEVREG